METLILLRKNFVFSSFLMALEVILQVVVMFAVVFAFLWIVVYASEKSVQYVYDHLHHEKKIIFPHHKIELIKAGEIKGGQQKEVKKEKKEKIKNTISSVRMIAPPNMQTVSNFQHTSSIGTADHPTLDGGIINSADGLPVYHPAVETIVENKKGKNNDIANNEISSQVAIKRSFADGWATSPRIKTILEKAAQTGKLDYVLNKSDQKNLPASVALLPIIESAYHDNAVSSKGAVGSWQLMPKTARENGISPHERSDFIPSTGAALNYLDQLHKEFGNWTLAFAAYNAGQGRVM